MIQLKSETTTILKCYAKVAMLFLTIPHQEMDFLTGTSSSLFYALYCIA